MGIDTAVREDDVISMPARDWLFVHQALGELVNFFHQPLNYKNISQLEDYLGARGEGGAIDLLFESYYEAMGKCMPEHVEALFEQEHFDNS